jgi:hypothetical protein
MTIKTQHRSTGSKLALAVAVLFTACSANTSAASPPSTEVGDNVVWVDLYCVIEELALDDETHKTFEEFCLYEGPPSNPYPHQVLREWVEEDGAFTSTGNDGSMRTGECFGEYLDEYPRASERDAGVLPHTPGALQGHQLCTFTGTFTGGGEHAGQDLVEEGSMYRASNTTFRGHMAVREAP